MWMLDRAIVPSLHPLKSLLGRTLTCDDMMLSDLAGAAAEKGVAVEV